MNYVPHHGLRRARIDAPTFIERLALNTVVVTALDAVLRVTRLRDRLRCPHCDAVGTFKPHGTLLDVYDLRDEPRWLCKWCGYYLGPEGSTVAVLNEETRVWIIPDGIDGGWTPECSFKTSPVGFANPWRG